MGIDDMMGGLKVYVLCRVSLSLVHEMLQDYFRLPARSCLFRVVLSNNLENDFDSNIDGYFPH